MLEFLWPRGGWARAFEYVKHRLRRLPDTPEKISRGFAVGAFMAFTPFYGLHFILSLVGAKLIRGNLIASLMGTFVGNPLTYVPIAVVSLRTGWFLLGERPDNEVKRSVGQQFADAGAELWHNFLSLFTAREAHWDGLLRFWQEVFFPYLIGGIIPGLIVAVACYWLLLPLVRAYQNQRRKRLGAKLSKLTQSRGDAG